MIRILCAALLISIPASASAHVAPELGVVFPPHETRGSCQAQAGRFRAELGSQSADYEVYCEEAFTGPFTGLWVIHVHAR